MTFPLFPFDHARPVQNQFMKDLADAARTRMHFIAHAPTGLGKTAASLSPLIEIARNQGLTILFLTSRHTQHEIVMRTVRAIKEKHGVPLVASSLISKRLMCSQEGSSIMHANDFASFCSSLREDNKCEYYSNARQSNYMPTVIAASVVKELQLVAPVTSEVINQYATDASVCPYEAALLLATKSDVIVCDYSYAFAPSIRDGFFAKIGKTPQECIIVIDEGHNLPQRMREQLTERLTTGMIKRAIKEAKDIDAELAREYLVMVNDVLISLAEKLREGDEILISEDAFSSRLKATVPIEDLVSALETTAAVVRAQKKNSSIGAIARFIAEWNEGTEGFCRLISVSSFRNEPLIQLSKRCLDPSLVTAEVIQDSFMTVMMSGTLLPTSMYRSLLGFPANTVEKVYPSPFPDKNRLTLIVPRTTTKFSERSPEQFRNIATICAEICNTIEGCSALFFPSYAIARSVLEYFNALCRKTVFLEEQGMTKEGKDEMLRRFSSYKESGAVLIGVASGSFGEGVDLPGVLRCVIVVGLPLDRPDLETKELIAYYDRKFKKGIDYGYILPALTKTLQNAGRCIRTEHDKGALIFLDERYAWPMYRKCFPQEWNIEISTDIDEKLEEFFS